MRWNYSDQPNMAVITSRKIIAGHDWIAYVFHDEDDGGWQFLGSEGFTEKDAVVVVLREVWELDQSIGGLLMNLPLGCRASRESNISPWVIESVCL